MATNDDERTDVFDPKTGMFYDSADGPPDPASPRAKAWDEECRETRRKLIERGSLRPVSEMGKPFSELVGTTYLGVKRIIK
jgi:hypothetical protein